MKEEVIETVSYGPLVFNCGSDEPITNELWPAKKSEILSARTEGKKLLIAGPYFDGEIDSMGISRAAKIKTLFIEDIDDEVDLDVINDTDDDGSDNGEYFDLWQNWKDHFFYAISAHFKPSGVGSTTSCSSDCVKVSGTEYAGIIFFSGLKQAVAGVDQTRYAPPFDGALALDGVDDKDDISNYLEDNNVADFPDNTGNADYDPVNAVSSNDVMFCIRQDMSVIECL